jgi:HSP20 family molecular chaperone IbpA
METTPPQVPNETLANVRQAIDNVLDETLAQPLDSVNEESDPLTSTTLAQTERDYLIKTGLPGVAPDQIEVILHNDQVMIRAEVTRSVQRTEEGSTRLDRVVERFYRSIGLPGAATSEGASAVLENGVLRITIPRVPSQPPHRLAVEAGTSSKAAEG